MVRKKDIVWLRAAGYPEAMKTVIENLNALLQDKAASLKKARAGDPSFFARESTFASPGKVTPAEIEKAVNDLSTHMAQITENIALLNADLAQFEK